MIRADGPFDVKVTPVTETPFSRLSLDKQFHGDLEATGLGEMLATRSSAEGSGGYVAIERVTGTLHGRSGSFVLLHRGTMSGGGQRLELITVPGSGTGELAGIDGRMAIRVVERQHFYDLEYTLPDRR